MTIRTASAGALLALVAMAANACGDDSDSGDGAAGHSGSATTGGTAGRGGTGSGGAATGGKSTGGNASGGSATGGSSTGGTATAGAGAGGDTMAGEGGGGGEPPGGSGGAPSGDAGSSGEGGGNDGGFAGVPGEPKGGPLLEGPSKAEYECKATQGLKVLDTPTPADLIPSVPAVVWTTGPAFGSPKSGVYWSQIAASGALTATKTIKEGDFNPQYVSAAARADRTTLVWDESEGAGLNRILRAQVDENGEIVSAPAPLVDSEFSQTAPVIAAAPDGYGITWIEYDQGDATLAFARLDAAGELVGTPRALPVEGVNQVSSFVSIGDGFALAYSSFASGSAMTSLLALDGEGVPRRAAVPLSGNYFSRPDLLVRDDELLVAWSHTTGGYDDSDIASTIRIGWFDAHGNPIRDTYELQSAVEDEENVDPAWAVIGDDLGLIWGHGSVIYICAGCIPDERLEFVVLDGETFEPRSELVTIQNTETNGGLLNPKFAVEGNNLRVMSAVTYHTSAAVGTAQITCE